MKIFIDTAPFIYMAEAHPVYAERTKKFIAFAFANQDSLLTSVISLMEFSVKPERDHKTKSIAKLRSTWNRLNVQMLSIDESIAQKAAKLRAKYPALKGLDSLQISAALLHGCQQFLTNDIPLQKIEEIEVILIEQL
ncbi:MAG TPA: PIN domain-containing protein [Saprospiraceae bacterium]|nr:PIN domain-containing protein [Saprospiraceae bacterium]HMP25320.1 PIN domain-containing protein [Saprospiraceae bacterium]